MSKLSKVVLGVVGAWVALAAVHAWLNLGISPASLFGAKPKGVAEEARFRVGFLPVT